MYKKISPLLSTATCALLGTHSLLAHAAHEDKQSVVSNHVGFLVYHEGDGRVSAFSPQIGVKQSFGEDRHLKLTLGVDVIIGATPIGITPSGTVQTFTRPSGNGSYSVQPGELPLDDTFMDTRFYGDLGVVQQFGDNTEAEAGFSISSEFDFFSVGGNASISQDFNQHNTTITLGGSGEFDSINPVGGVPTPFAAMAAPGVLQPRLGEKDTRSTIDGIIGITQVLTRRWLVQLNYNLSHSRGYQSDPYKLVTEVTAAGIHTGTYLYEHRPDNRVRQSLFLKSMYNLYGDIIKTAYRYYRDNWGIDSHTLDLAYRWRMSDRHYLEPSFRFYRQSEADFFNINILVGAPLPTYASADYRLAAFNAYTFGVKYGTHTKAGDLSARIDYYYQDGDDKPDSAIGIQRAQDLFPDMGAIMAQFIWGF